MRIQLPPFSKSLELPRNEGPHESKSKGGGIRGGGGGYAPDPTKEKKEKKIKQKDFFFPSLDCLDRHAIQKTLTKLNVASIETIDELTAALSIQQRLVFRIGM
jgi:hypothetical protein